jgi:DEAD/DEAH box helicase domain-containing protein
MTLIVTDNNPLDQYYADKPSILFEKSPEQVSIQLKNSIILESHIQCAAEEHPIDMIQDQNYFGSDIEQICQDHLVKIDHNVSSQN